MQGDPKSVISACHDKARDCQCTAPVYFIDSGGCFDPYVFKEKDMQYGIQIRRPFTLYQLRTVAEELSEIGNDKVVILSALNVLFEQPLNDEQHALFEQIMEMLHRASRKQNLLIYIGFWGLLGKHPEFAKAEKYSDALVYV